jgi:putative molybdopterin biosynthesis protein
VHLLDESGEYNMPYVRHFFPDRPVEVVTLAHRTQGLVVPPGNPRQIRRVPDLTRSGLRFVNRNAGSGTRLWFDRELKRLGIAPGRIRGYGRALLTHDEIALAVHSRRADAAIGLQAAAQRHGLDFVPLFEERYDLVLPRSHEHSLRPLLDYLQTARFRRELSLLQGYSTTHSGEQIPV